MPLGIAQEVDQEEAAALEALREPEPPEEGDDGDLPPALQAEVAEVAEATEVAQETEQPAAEDASSDAKTEDDSKSDKDRDRANLRAARIAERRALAKAERLEREIEELRKQVPAAAQAEDELTDDDLAEVEHIPAVAKALRQIQKLREQLPQQTQQAESAAEEFSPPQLPPEVQEAVDDIPELLAWQNTPDQVMFERAKRADHYLLSLDEWKSKPKQERLAEVVRRVKAEQGQSAAQPAVQQPRIDPRAAIANAPTRTPKSIGEIGTGTGRTPLSHDVGRFREMSTEDVEAELMTRG